MRPLKVLLLIVGLLFATTGLGLITAGAGAVVTHAVARDDDGFFRPPRMHLQSPTRALVSEEIHLGGDIADGAWYPEDVGTVRLEVGSAGERPLFVGIGPSDEVQTFLSGTTFDRLDEYGGGVASYERSPGEREVARPTDQDFWVATSVGTGDRSLDWEIANGNWTVVVMNADASPGVDVSARAGLRTGWVLIAGLLLLGGALVALFVGALLIVLAVRRDPPQPLATAPAHLPPADKPVHHEAIEPYPLTVSGHLDLELSRWMWLVKWFLAIPHLFVLTFLWLAAGILTVVAGLAILFTGRYPRSIFDFNVGVMRWSWRVTFYAFTLGTDRYPRFSLDPDPAYPAELDVEYPTTLSRPLVLVKWLLALPHLLIVGLFGGGIALDWTWLTNDSSGFQAGFAGGVVGLLVLIAAVALAFTGTYPQALFDLVMGMERWSFRVFAYVGLMTDEYPPFRLDGGGSDPGAVPHFVPDPTHGPSMSES